MPTNPPPEPAAESAQFVPFATTALDCHRAAALSTAHAPTSRVELDQLHAHAVALYGLLDAHTSRTGPVATVEGDHLRSCRMRLWQAADHLHDAFHTAPHPDGSPPAREGCQARLPEGAPELTICQRHQAATARVRREYTPTDLHDPLTGIPRH